MPLSSGNEQVEQDRASLVFVYQCPFGKVAQTDPARGGGWHCANRAGLTQTIHPADPVVETPQDTGDAVGAREGGDRDFAGNYDAWATGAGRLRSVRS